MMSCLDPLLLLDSVTTFCGNNTPTLATEKIHSHLSVLIVITLVEVLFSG